MSTEAIQLPTAAVVPSLPSNYGDRFVVAVREYLHANNLRTLGQINAKILAEIAQRFHDKSAAAAKTKRKSEIESEWLKEMEADPTWAGIDIKRELGKCQFWCKTNGKVATRARFANWLLKAERPVNFTYDGASSRPKPVAPPKPAASASAEVPVAGWPLILRNQVEGLPADKVDAFCASDWHELPSQIRETIAKFA